MGFPIRLKMFRGYRDMFACHYSILLLLYYISIIFCHTLNLTILIHVFQRMLALRIK